TASTRAFQSRQRKFGGRSTSSRSKSGSGLDFRAMASEPVEAKGWASGELARGAKRDQAVEQPPAGAVAQARDGRGGGDGVVGEQRLERARLPLGAQFWAHVREPGRPARQVLRQVEGGERRPGVGERNELHPAGLARPRPLSLACGAAGEQLAGEQRQRRWPA